MSQLKCTANLGSLKYPKETASKSMPVTVMDRLLALNDKHWMFGGSAGNHVLSMCHYESILNLELVLYEHTKYCT